MNTYSSVRDELIGLGILEPIADGSHFQLTTDTIFRSPSEAASVLLNRNSNGRVEWKLESGQTLRDWQDAQIEKLPAP